jgi:ABC-type transport system involved in multi-copper enzyme maturation permease subunit
VIWLTWRQFRTQALASLVVLAAATIWLLITGLNMHHAYGVDLTSCRPQGNCAAVLNPFSQGYNSELHLAEILALAAPGLIGIFWGAPLIGHELETGTHQLAWNQSVTRTRWLAVKIVGLVAVAVAVAALLSYLLTWWAGPLDHITGNRFAATTFATRDLVPLGYAAFAFMLGTTAGLLLRRTIPAMAVTLALFAGIQILMPAVVRPNLLSSTTVTFAVDRATGSKVGGFYTQGGGARMYLAGLPVPRGAWVTSAPPIETATDRVVAAHTHLTCFPQTAPETKSGGIDADQILGCLTPYDLHEAVTYQPVSHYWPLQWYETGIFLALASALSGLCFWQIRRRQN